MPASAPISSASPANTEASMTTPARIPTSAAVALNLVRDIQTGVNHDDDDSMDVVLDALTDPMADAIHAGDHTALFAAVEPALRDDPGLIAWLGAPGVGSWLDSYLGRLRTALDEAMVDDPADAPNTAPASDVMPHHQRPRIAPDDSII
jgi:hypothetical protein